MDFHEDGLQWAFHTIQNTKNSIATTHWDHFMALQSNDRSNYEQFRHNMRKLIPTKDHESRLEFDLIASRIRTALLMKQRQLRELFEFNGLLSFQIAHSKKLEEEKFFLPIVMKTP